MCEVWINSFVLGLVFINLLMPILWEGGKKLKVGALYEIKIVNLYRLQILNFILKPVINIKITPFGSIQLSWPFKIKS